MRLIVLRPKPTSGSQLALLVNRNNHACITDRYGDTRNWRQAVAAAPGSRIPSAT